MNPHQLHLLVNHISIIGIAFGLGILLLSFIPKLKTFGPVALVIFIVSAAALPVAFQSGEQAEEIVEELRGADENSMEIHEHQAETFRNFGILLGLLSIAALATRSKHNDHPAVYGGLLALGLLAMSQGSQTGHSGGLIRRPELRQAENKTNSPVVNDKSSELEDDD